jgi:UDP-N-acetylglucosamine 2-epimerase
MIALCYGTRPQVIKASRLRSTLARLGPVRAVDTGQHYDWALSGQLYEQLGVAQPDCFLEVGSGSHAEQTGLVLLRTEAALRELGPRVVVAIGDTNSTVGVALAAAKLRIPVVHVEAGLRARDRLMPEEINRRAVDAIASVLCTPSAVTTARMQAEHPDAVVRETGDIALDVLLAARGRLPAPETIVPGLVRPYVFATLHRAELTDQPDVLGGVVRALAAMGTATILALHPRTATALTAQGITQDRIGLLRLVPAIGYLESLALTAGARAVVTDSGGLQREAYWLGTPCVTVRSETEWEETIACGANRLVPPAEVSRGLADALTGQVARWNGESRWAATAYGDGQAAERIRAAVAELLQ